MKRFSFLLAGAVLGMAMPVAAHDGEGQTHAHRVAVTQLPNGYRLLVSGLLDDRDDVRFALWRAILGALLLAVLLAIGGSLAIRRHLNRMVEVVARAANNIADGNLTRRPPRDFSADPLDRVSASLNRILERIEALIEENRTMTDALAHDLRSPLTRISANLDHAANNSASKDLQDSIPSIEQEVALMLRMIDDTLEISRAKAGMGRENFEFIDLAEILESLHEMYLPLAEMQGVALTLDCERGLMVHCNKGLVARSIANLIDNAFKHGMCGKEIALSGHAEGMQVVVSVADRGKGIPVERYADVMQKFRRLSSARTLPGMGVGLALVTAIAKLHNGELQLDDNRPGLVARLILKAVPIEHGAGDWPKAVPA